MLTADPLSPANCEVGPHGSDLFVQYNPQMLTWIEIWGIWGPSLHFKFIDALFKPFLNHSSFVGGSFTLLEEATAIMEYRYYESVHMICSLHPHRPLSKTSHCLYWLVLIMHPGARCSPGKQHTCIEPSTCGQGKHDSFDQATSSWCSRPLYWRFLLFRRASMGTPTGLSLCSLIHNNMSGTVCSYTFLFSAVWVK